MTNVRERTEFRGARLVSTYVQVIDATPDRVFPLLCPVRESEWVDGWVGRPVFARSGVAELDGVYATEHEDSADDTLWVITRFDATVHTLEFVTFVPGSQVFRLSIAVRPLGRERSEVSITYVRTGITSQGNRALEERRRTSGDHAMMREWELDMNHYLTTGHARRQSDASDGRSLVPPGLPARYAP